MSRMRQRIAERLKESQNVNASLTTFNEIDMRYCRIYIFFQLLTFNSKLIELRNKYKDAVFKKYDIKLGFMSPFVKAAVQALHEIPSVNARIEDDQIVYSDFMDISVAVSTPIGLVTPVIRNCESLSMIQVEKAIAGLSKKVDIYITITNFAQGSGWRNIS